MRSGPGEHNITWIIYNNQEELINSYWREPLSMPLAVIFHTDDPINGQLKYEIRTNPLYVVTPSTTELFSSNVVCRQTITTTWSPVFPKIETGDTCPVNQYYYSGFLAVQALFDYTKIRVSSFCYF